MNLGDVTETMFLEENKRIIIGITGMPGSGKGVFSDVAKEFGFHSIVMGDIIREEVRKQGLEVNRKNSNAIMIQLREKYGKNVVAVRTTEKIHEAIKAGKNLIIVDGLRSLFERDTFRKEFPDFEVIAFHAPPSVRYERIIGRTRRDDAKSIQENKQRDELELKVGIGNLIALADYMIDTNHDLDTNKKVFHEFLDDLMQKKGLSV